MTNYKTMNKAELKALAEERNVEVAEDATNKEIAEALENAENNAPEPDSAVITSSDVSGDQPDNAPVVAGDEADKAAAPKQETVDVPVNSEEVKSDDKDKVVVKFVGRNASYIVANMKFTRQHPFHTVSEDLSDYLVSTGSFEKASSDEVAEYYK